MISKWVQQDTPPIKATEIINILSRYLSSLDNSTLSKKDKDMINDMCRNYPQMMAYICRAYREYGYDQF